MLTFLSLLTIFCLVQHGLSLRLIRDAGDGPVTNAQRLARGLSVAPPKRLFGSKTESARRSQISTSPGWIVTGTIQFTSAGQTYYLDNYGFPDNPGSGATFQYVDPASASTPVTISILDSNNAPTGQYLGLLQTWQDDITDSSSFPVQVWNTFIETGQGATPTWGGYLSPPDMAYLETSVFMIDPATGDVTATWVNPGGGTAPDLVLSTDGCCGVYLGSGDYYNNWGYTPIDSMTFIQDL